ncbi:hypothetical protein JCM19240_878 [Vibrio maritimus]|uniref:Uncharacterized protein n=1 Tax=Vibrio maritimus TaxID=990268 RepID=A0A090T1U2_9VIBR|nr:hypothetical protein JCM19240_878 [Vibrio maritimus]
MTVVTISFNEIADSAVATRSLVDTKQIKKRKVAKVAKVPAAYI